jgi:meso-butanediol dehydrogenase / (S,S)-butanediol dehydrogenase / diacetyl reductase
MAGDNRAVIVTGGGGSGCGRSISIRFAAGGAPVVVSDIDETGGRETVRTITDLGRRASFCHADVRVESQVRDLVSFAEKTYGGVGVLVNNASATHDDEGIESWARPLETDLLGAIHATRWVIEAMKRGGGGAIVNVASISALWHGRKTPGGFGGYDVAKAGMIRMTTRLETLAQSDGIRVNCLAPGWIASGGALQYWESLTPAERIERHVPSRLLAPDEIAEAVVRLAEDRSLAGRVVVWWSEDSPRLITWGDRGYCGFLEF